MLDKLRAVFLLADIEVKSFHRLPNGYCPEDCCSHRPWALVETKYGLIKIGWRKKVISIEWSKDLKIHGKDTLAKGDDWVTSLENGVHAWGYGKAIDQLVSFAGLAEKSLKKEAIA